MNTAKITEELIALGMRQHAIADYCGVSQSTVSRWRKGIDPEGPSRDKLFELHRETLSMIHPGADNDFSEPKPTTVQIPDLAIHGGLGGGGLLDVTVDKAGRPIDPDQINGFWTFPDYMVRSMRNLSRIYAWEVRGDSMEPTLAGGSVVFVDTTQNVPPPEDIYAINYGDGLMVKRLKLVPRSEFIEVISDNERYGTDRIAREEVQIYGRVIGWFQWRG